MVDVLLTHSYHLPYDSKQLQKMQPYRPLGTLYAAAALREAGFSVALFDTMLNDPKAGFSACLDENEPRILVIYEDDFNFLTKMCLSRMREVVWHFVEEAKGRGLPIVIHGSDASDHPDLFLGRGIDYLLRGEAEATLVELCLALTTGSAPQNIAGMMQHTSAGEIAPQNTIKAPNNPAWAHLPSPPLDLIDHELYRKAWKNAHNYFSINMAAGRGCPFRCNWCAKPISGNKFLLRAAAEVAEEMRLMKAVVGADHIWFSDDVFALNQHWVLDFAREITARHAALPFKIQSRADLMTDQTVAALKQAGCAEVWMGVESGSQKVLDLMDKGLKVSEVEDARRRLKHAGIRACFFLQLGYPGEHWKELKQTIALVRATQPDDVGISFSYPLPGTVFYERVQTQLGTKRNWIESDDLCILFQAEYTTEFYRAVRDALHVEVDSWTDTTSASQSRAQLLWNEVERLEPISRNSLKNNTPYAHSSGLVSVDKLIAKAGA